MHFDITTAIGMLAGVFYLASHFMKDMVPLRVLALASNLLFLIFSLLHTHFDGSRQSHRTDNPGWGGLFIRIAFLLLMVIDQIHSICRAAFKPENDPPVSRHGHRPETRQRPQRTSHTPNPRLLGSRSPKTRFFPSESIPVFSTSL